ncbi:MAG: hypothetical protein K2M07_07565 [Muribaculaceae bacterium]|nr:hypothetical protein [Muribaculaceae bacterium]
MKQYFSIIIFSLLLAGCSASDELQTPDVGYGSDDIMLTMEVTTPEPHLSSRYDSEGHDEVESDYRNFENGVDINDIAMYVFAKIDSDSEAEEKLVAMFTPNKPQNLTYSSEDMEVLGADGRYTVNFMLKKKEFLQMMGLNENSSENTPFRIRIVMFANSTIYSGTGSLNYNKWISGFTKGSTTVTEAFDKMTGWNETMGYIYDNPNSDDNTLYKVTDLYPNPEKQINPGGQVVGGGKLYMPMFGQSTFTVSRKTLANTDPVNRYNLGDFLLLRSVAKMRVVDNIQNKNEQGYPKIIAAQITGDQDLIMLLPHDAANYVNGTQVHYPNVGTPGSNTPNAYKLGYIPDGWAISPAVEKKGYLFVGYCPEQTIHSQNYDVNPGYPIFNITVAISKDDAGNEVTKVYDVPMAKFSENDGGFGQYILRNHIYTLSVDRVQLAGLSINVAVKDWKKYDYIYEY